MGRWRSLLALGVLAAAALLLVAAPGAGTYGNAAQYQVGFSFNCPDKTSFFCTNVVGIGGEWGWYAFNNDGSFDATITFCAHSQGFNGAGHQNLDGIWKTDTTGFPIFAGATDQTFWISTDGGQSWEDTMIPRGRRPLPLPPPSGDRGGSDGIADSRTLVDQGNARPRTGCSAGTGERHVHGLPMEGSHGPSITTRSRAAGLRSSG